MSRYELFDKIKLLCNVVKNSENNYSKMVFSGDLAITHYDYGRGLYDVNIFYIESDKKHYCRIWFGTIDDGGLWVLD